MKKVLITIVLLAIAYFIVGFIAVKLDWLGETTYYNFSAIIGGAASVSGLLAFGSNKIEKKDIEAVGVEYFKKVIESAEELEKREDELKSKEKQLTKKEKELAELEIKRQEMEFLVRKASMNIFLKDQFERTESRIIEIIHNNRELSKLLDEREKLNSKLIELQEEIDKSENVELLSFIIKSSELKREAKRTQPRSPAQLSWRILQKSIKNSLSIYLKRE